jgi:KUP system potassium uptake protein
MTLPSPQGGAPAVAAEPAPAEGSLGRRVVGALGVVYGDIATSPLYAFSACFDPTFGVMPTPSHVLGVTSLIVWTLVVVIAIKYAIIVLRADFNGEGGVLALTALASTGRGTTVRATAAILWLGLAGSALLYGDGLITPAISVLSALEGVSLAFPGLDLLVVPLTLIVLLAIGFLQRRGTMRVGALFGPVMIVWFVSLSALGLAHVVRVPEVLRALDPTFGVRFLIESPRLAFVVLGAVFLVVTGGEAMYADLGHFGRRPIRVAWFAVVMPALILNYLGQAALVLDDPMAAGRAFYRLAPEGMLLPLIGLAALATIIASQAVISGAFSQTHQAMHLGLLPPLEEVHYSSEAEGRVYMPLVNWSLVLGAAAVVLAFRSSGAMAGAYGLAVSGTMVVTTVLVLLSARRLAVLHPIVLVAVLLPVLALELVFLASNSVKLRDGGWLPLAVASVVVAIASTWRRGQKLACDQLDDLQMSDDDFAALLARSAVTRVPGTVVFVRRLASGVPVTLVRLVTHGKALHQRVILLRVDRSGVPRVPARARIEMHERAAGMLDVTARYGFMQMPNLPVVLRALATYGVDVDPESVSYYFARERVVLSDRPGMARWRKRLYAFMSRNRRDAPESLHLPPERVMEILLRVEV